MSVSVHEISKEFLRLYHKCLNVGIEHAHKFYHENAEVVYRLVEQRGSDKSEKSEEKKEEKHVEGTRDVKKIQEKIESFKDWERTEQGMTFLCEFSDDEAIVIMVRGNVKTKDGRRGKYSQTFFLVKRTNEDKVDHYLVRNDLLHIEEISSKVSKKNNLLKRQRNKAETKKQKVAQPSPQKKVPEKNAEVKPVQPKKNDDSQKKNQKTAQKDVPKVAPKDAKASKAKAVPKEAKEVEPKEASKQSKPKKSGPMTYASIVETKQAIEKKKEEEKKKAAAKSAPKLNGQAEATPNATKNKPKSPQLFGIHVGKLEFKTPTAELEEAFSKFGEIERVQNKTMDGNRYAFIFFKTEKAMNAALSAKIIIGENEVNIQPRTSSRSLKPKPAPRKIPKRSM